jgi:putative ABC transport system permease protein
MSAFSNELKWAARRLRRTPASTLSALALLSLSIACTVTLFAVARSVLLAPLPFREPHRLVVLERQIGDQTTPLHSPADLLDLRDGCDAFVALSGSTRFRALLTGTEQPAYVTGASITPEYLDTLGAEPILGRPFRVLPGGGTAEPDAVVVSWTLWRKYLKGGPQVIGRTLLVDDEPHRVVAVMPEAVELLGVDLWMPGPQRVPRPPRPVGPDLLVRRDLAYVTILGRLAPGWSLESARAALATAGAGLVEAYPPEYPEVRFTLEPFEDRIFARAKDHLTILWTCVGLVFVIGCLSVSGLLLARGIARSDEDAIRVAIGAMRRQAALAGLSESLVLAVVGGVLGGLGSIVGIQLFLALAPAFPRSDQTAVDAWVVVGTALSALVAALLAGLFPTVRALWRPADAVRSTGARISATRSRKYSWNGLLALQVACLVVLLVAASILGRRALELGSVDLGFAPQGVRVALLELPRGRYPDPEALTAFYRELLGHLEALPELASVGAGLPLPLSGAHIGGSFSIVGPPVDPGHQSPSAALSAISPGYFRTLGISVVAGRAFGPGDRSGAPPVAIVNQALARRYWRSGTPLGRELVLRDGIPFRIVGVVKDIRHDLSEADIEPRIYRPLLQQPTSAAWLTIRARHGSEHLDQAVRRIIAEIDPAQPVPELAPMEAMLSSVLQPVHYLLMIVGGLAALALAICAVSLYALVTLTVHEEERDLALRLALGASRSVLLRRYLSRGLLIATVGTFAGTVGAMAGSPLLGRALSADDDAGPLLISVVVLVVVVCATLAILLGARRVLLLNPSRAVRDL